MYEFKIELNNKYWSTVSQKKHDLKQIALFCYFEIYCRYVPPESLLYENVCNYIQLFTVFTCFFTYI